MLKNAVELIANDNKQQEAYEKQFLSIHRLVFDDFIFNVINWRNLLFFLLFSLFLDKLVVLLMS